MAEMFCVQVPEISNPVLFKKFEIGLYQHLSHEVEMIMKNIVIVEHCYFDHC